MRNVRRDGMDDLKRMEKSGDLSEDEHHLWGEEIQRLTDDMIGKISETYEAKQKEIMQV